jgi:branched-chain amino acid transport system permease protein
MLEIIIFSTLNGILYGLLLFMLSSGLTLIFSMMGVLNFAHASFYMLGAYVAYSLGMVVGFWPALFLAPLVVGLLGALVEKYGLRRVHENGHVAELLFTFGLAYVINELVQLIWGPVSVAYREPAYLREPLFTLMGTDYSIFRGGVILISALMLVALWYLLKKTRVGLMVRASLTHGNMVGHLGHNVPRLFMGVFGFGCALAGLAGVMGGPLLATEPGRKPWAYRLCGGGRGRHGVPVGSVLCVLVDRPDPDFLCGHECLRGRSAQRHWHERGSLRRNHGYYSGQLGANDALYSAGTDSDFPPTRFDGGA